MEDPSLLNNSQTETPSSIAFVHALLDEYGLDPYEFRLYAHIIRRTGGKTRGICFAKLSTISGICKISTRKTQQIIKILMSANFITQTKRPGRTDEYRVRPASEWVPKKELVEIRERLKRNQQKELVQDLPQEEDPLLLKTEILDDAEIERSATVIQQRHAQYLKDGIEFDEIEALENLRGELKELKEQRNS